MINATIESVIFTTLVIALLIFAALLLTAEITLLLTNNKPYRKNKADLILLFAARASNILLLALFMIKLGFWNIQPVSSQHYTLVLIIMSLFNVVLNTIDIRNSLKLLEKEQDTNKNNTERT